MYALYARQSIEKQDSISVESQLDFCKYEVRGEPFKTYIDKGFSGKNTKRPAFEQMFSDIKLGKISKVVVYKLDRISRSILDFSNMMETFQQYNVEFISSTEKFDTSTPIGRAMLNICIVFAQLERETIQKRVSDAYYSRSKKGFYMGGRIPYGFRKEELLMDGIRTSKYVSVTEECEQIYLMYKMYVDPSKSLGDIIRYFNDNEMKHMRGGIWNTSRISDILRNPVYVQADAALYEFFKSQGVNIINPIEDFTGENACYLFKGTVSSTRKQSDLTDKEIVLAPHAGIIPSKDWIQCRTRCQRNRQSTQTCKAKNSWLAGKVKCGNCGYALTIAKANTKWHRYFVCSAQLSSKGSRCKGIGGTIYADVLEEYILTAVRNKLNEFQLLPIPYEAVGCQKINENKIRLVQIKTEIDDLLSKVSSANSILMNYINEKIEGLDKEYQSSKKIFEELSCKPITENLLPMVNHVERWKKTSFEDKQAIVNLFIKVIHIANGNIEIEWRI